MDSSQDARCDSSIPLPLVRPPVVFTLLIRTCSIVRSVDIPAHTNIYVGLTFCNVSTVAANLITNEVKITYINIFFFRLNFLCDNFKIVLGNLRYMRCTHIKNIKRKCLLFRKKIINIIQSLLKGPEKWCLAR